MKKKLTYLLSTLTICAAFNTASIAQKAVADKQVTVTIRSTNRDGSTNTTTVMKSGADAESFDVQKYIQEQTKDKQDIYVFVNEKNTTPQYEQDNKHSSTYNLNYNDAPHAPYVVTKTWQNINSNKGFLGVSEMHSPVQLKEGVRVSITRHSGADKAGLKDDDIILHLNKTPINSFRDVSMFMRNTKAGDKVDVIFDRDGLTQTVVATLGNQQESWTVAPEKEKDACLGVYTSSRVIDTQRGAIIEDFTPLSAAQESNMQVGDLITSVNGVRVKTHQDVWDEIAKYKPQTTVKVEFLRQNAPKQIKATLKACKPKDEDVIVVPKTQEESPKINVPTHLGKLELERFSASPNPTKDMVNISFKGQPVPTTVSLYDLTGKVLYQQTITDFSGDYNQRFDVNEYAKGVVVVKVQQGDNVFSKQIIVN